MTYCIAAAEARVSSRASPAPLAFPGAFPRPYQQ
jgi:hypothetical protein